MTKTENISVDQKRTCGFRKGLGRVGSEFKGDLLKKLSKGFGLSPISRTALYNRINGFTPLTPLEVPFVEQCLIEAMVPADCIWDLQN